MPRLDRLDLTQQNRIAQARKQIRTGHDKDAANPQRPVHRRCVEPCVCPACMSFEMRAKILIGIIYSAPSLLLKTVAHCVWPCSIRTRGKAILRLIYVLQAASATKVVQRVVAKRSGETEENAHSSFLTIFSRNARRSPTTFA